jgi:hypothetical protein
LANEPNLTCTRLLANATGVPVIAASGCVSTQGTNYVAISGEGSWWRIDPATATAAATTSASSGGASGSGDQGGAGGATGGGSGSSDNDGSGANAGSGSGDDEVGGSGSGGDANQAAFAKWQ